MYDYLNEFLLFYGKRNREGATYRAARQIKAQGDVYLFNRLCREWSSRFIWESDDMVLSSQIERTILTSGACGIYKDANGVLRCARATGLNGLSYYGLPNSCDLVAYNGDALGKFIPMQGEEYDNISNCVLIFDNLLGDRPIASVMYYYQRLSQISAQLSGALQNILGTQIIHANREAIRDIERQREAARIGVPYLVSYDSMYDGTQSNIEILQTEGISDTVKLLQESFEKTHHDFLVAIGIYANTEIDKESGVSDLEITVNSERTDTMLETARFARDLAVKQCKALGFNLTYRDADYLGKTQQITDAAIFTGAENMIKKGDDEE